MAEQGVNYTASSTPSNHPIFTADAPAVLGFVQITNQAGNGAAEISVAILSEGDAELHRIIPDMTLEDGESFPFPGAWVINAGQKVAVSSDTDGITFHLALSHV